MKRSIHNPILSLAMTVMLALNLVALTGCEKPASVTGEQGNKLVLFPLKPIAIKQTELVEVKVVIDRGAIKEPVVVSFEQLPKGVTVVDANQKIIGAEGMYVLKADEAADLVAGHHAKVTAKGPQGMAVTQELIISVIEKKGS